jgi:hypothetical protein
LFGIIKGKLKLPGFTAEDGLKGINQSFKNQVYYKKQIDMIVPSFLFHTSCEVCEARPPPADEPGHPGFKCCRDQCWERCFWGFGLCRVDCCVRADQECPQDLIVEPS